MPVDATPHNLPVQKTPPIGVEADLSQLREGLARHGNATIIGGPGLGKSRIAVHLAETLVDDMADGTWSVALDTLIDPSLVPQTVASVLDVRAGQDKDYESALILHLRDKRCLLVLDNCEPVLDGAAMLAVGLLERCPGLSIVATSTEPLNISGEWIYRLSPLICPDGASAQQLSASAAGQLLIDRAMNACPTFGVTDSNAAPLADLCRQLAGLPLAIELVAAWVDDVPAGQITEQVQARQSRSQEREPQQVVLQAVVDWCYDRLSEDEQKVWRRLSVFAGGFDVAAVVAMHAGKESHPVDVPQILQHLVERHLIASDESADGGRRYYMHDALRLHARKRLEQSGELEPMHDDHLRTFLELAEEARPHLEDARDAGWLRRLDAEVANLRLALDWARSRRPELAVRLGGNLAYFWFQQAYVREGIERISQILALPQAREAPEGRAQLLGGLADLSSVQGRWKDATDYARASQDIWRDLGRQDRLAAMLNLEGFIAVGAGDLDIADDCYHRALQVSRDNGHQLEAAGVLVDMTFVACMKDRADEARSRLQEAVTAADALERRPFPSALVSFMEGLIALLEADHDTAQARLADAIEWARQSNHPRMLIHALMFGARAARQPNREQAWRLGLESLRTRQTESQHELLAEHLDLMAGLLVDAGSMADAACLYGAANAHRTSHGTRTLPLFQRWSDAELERMRDAIGDQAMSEARAQGESMDRWEAVEMAIAAMQRTDVAP